MSQRSPPLRRRPARARSNELNEADAERKTRSVSGPLPERLSGGTSRAPVSPEIPELGSGEPLDAVTLADMQSRFDADLSAVRLHTNAAAARMADSFDAEAFAVGSHVVFGRKFDPAGEPDRKLLAHEIAHVLEPQDPHAPMVQRQPKPPKPIQGLKPIYFEKMRKVLLTQPGIDADTASLVRSLDLTSTKPQRIKRITAGNQQLDFNVTLKWAKQHGSHTVRSPVATNTAGADFEVTLGHTFAASDIPAKHPYWSIKDAVDQRAWLMAQTLHHELLHVQIETDKIVAASDPNATFSEAFKQYVVTRSYLQEVQQPRFAHLGGDAVAATLKSIQNLIVQMCADVPVARRPSAAVRAALLKRALGFFVQEKYAFWKTAATFGPAPDNASIAHSYVRSLFAEALDADPVMGGRVFDNYETTRRPPVGFFGNLAQDLERQVVILFAYLDTELLLPGMRQLK